MRLEGVTVCVDFADLLAETLPLNLRHFDKLVVVTAPEDLETQRVCRYYGVAHAQTDQFRTRWGEMHKGRGINVGLRQLALDDWVIHLDADVVLPPRARQLLKRANLDAEMLYGCDRFSVRGFDAWRQHQAMPSLQQDGYHVAMDAFPIAPRFAGERMGGYAPPGFFQLWNPAKSGVTEYPENHSSASRTDVMFASKWWRQGRALLPEFVVYHLEPESAANGTNWDGRRTKRWGPVPDPRDHHHPRNHRPPPTREDWSKPRPHPHPHPGPGPKPHDPKPVNVVPPSIVHWPSYEWQPSVGELLFGDPGVWTGTPPIEFRFQWRTTTGTIPHADDQTYVVQATDVGQQLVVRVTAKNGAGSVWADSEPTPPVI